MRRGRIPPRETARENVVISGEWIGFGVENLQTQQWNKIISKQ
jgi:hypothetical protein